MEAASRAKPRSADSDPETRERVEEDIDRERAALRRAADPKREDELTEEEERGALSYLLGARKPLLYEVRATLETEDGEKPITFVFRQIDGRKLDEYETRNRNQTTMQLNALQLDTDIVVESCVAIEDETGRSVDPKSEDFRTTHPDQPPQASPGLALQTRFATQLGIISGVAREVRRVSGWNTDRVGTADRRLVDAAGG